MSKKQSQENHENRKPFKPTLAMLYFWRAYADPYVSADYAKAAQKAVELMAEDGVSPERIPQAESIRRMVYAWDNPDEYSRTEEYKEWKKVYWTKLMKAEEARLDKMGMQRAPKDFRYWEAMQKKYMDFKTKVDITTNDKEILPTTEIANMLGKILGEEDDSIPTTDTK